MIFNVPFEPDENGELHIRDAINQTVDYIANRTRLDKVYDYSDEEIEQVRELVQEWIPEQLSPASALLLGATIATIYLTQAKSSKGKKSIEGMDSLPEDLRGPLETFVNSLPANADVRVVDMNEKSDPLARLFKNMPDNPEFN